MGGDSPSNNPFVTCPKHTREEFIHPDMVIDGFARQPFKALVVGQSVLLNDPSKFVNCVLLLDIHRSK
jgi:hypothetical protein